MLSTFISYLFTICAFLWNVLSSLRLSSRISAIPDIDIEVGAGTIQVVEVVEVHDAIDAVQVLGDAKANAPPQAGITYCPAYADGVDVTTVQEAFLPSKLADAMERYGPGVADKPEPSHDRYSTVSEANTSEDHFFSEGESIASSVTSVDGFELREDKTKEVLDKVEGVTVSGVSDVLRREDEEPVDDILECYFSFSEGEEDEVDDEHYFSFSEEEVEDIEEGNEKVKWEIRGELREIDEEAEDGVGVEVGNIKERDGGDSSEVVEPKKAAIPTPLTGNSNMRSRVSHTIPDDRFLATSLDTEAPKPPRPAREPEEDLTDVLEFMERCNFELPPPAHPVTSRENKRPKLVPSMIVQAPLNFDPSRPRLVHSSGGQLAGVFGVGNYPGHKTTLPTQPTAPHIEKAELAPRIIVHRPSSDFIPPEPPRPLRNVVEDLTGVFEFMEDCNFELPPFEEEEDEFVPMVRSSSSDMISPGYFHYACPSNEDALGTLEFVELCECGLPLLPREPFYEDEVIEPTPTVVIHSPSLEKIPARPARPTRETHEDLTGLLNFMNQHDCELPFSGSGHENGSRENEQDIYLDFSLADRIDFSGGNRVDLLNPEDEWEAIFDIIDNFGVPFEEGQAFFVRAMERFEETPSEPKSCWSEESLSSTDDDDGTEGIVDEQNEVEESESKVREEGLVMLRPVTRISLRVRVAPQDYLQVPKRSFRRIQS